MAKKRIDQLTGTSTMANDDLFLIYDIDEAGSEKSKKMTYSDFHTLISGTVGGGGGSSYTHISEPGDDLLLGDQAETAGTAVRIDSANGIMSVTTSGTPRAWIQNDATDVELVTTFHNVTHKGASSGSTLYIGENNVRKGQLVLHGHGAGSPTGGSINLRIANDHVGSTYYYYISAFQDDLTIGPYTDTDSLKYDNANTIWEFTAGKVKITGIPSGATQVAAGVAVGQLWRTATHASLPDGVLMIGI